jgi:hypothetical protein
MNVAVVKLMKNKSTNEGREFWTHVENVAEHVRNKPELFNHKVVAPLNRASETQKCQTRENPDRHKK